VIKSSLHETGDLVLHPDRFFSFCVGAEKKNHQEKKIVETDFKSLQGALLSHTTGLEIVFSNERIQVMQLT